MGKLVKPMFIIIIRMPIAIKPMFFFVDPDGKRNKTNVFLCIRMANAMKPMPPDGKHNKTNVCCAYLDGKRNKTNVLFIRMAKAMKPTFVCISGPIPMANAIKPMFCLLSGWQT